MFCFFFQGWEPNQNNLYVFIPRILMLAAAVFIAIGMIFGLVGFCCDARCPTLTEGVLCIVGGWYWAYWIQFLAVAWSLESDIIFLAWFSYILRCWGLLPIRNPISYKYRHCIVRLQRPTFKYVLSWFCGHGWNGKIAEIYIVKRSVIVAKQALVLTLRVSRILQFSRILNDLRFLLGHFLVFIPALFIFHCISFCRKYSRVSLEAFGAFSRFFVEQPVSSKSYNAARKLRLKIYRLLLV